MRAVLVLASALVVGTPSLLASPALASDVDALQAPEFTHADAAHWLNTPPLTLRQLHGRVVLVEFWAFDCINCRRSVPWLHALSDAYRDRGLVVVGVHTPELSNERVPDNIRRATTRLDIRYPVMIDDDYSYWRAMRNQYWPAFYLIDRVGRVGLTRFGETHPGDANASALESAIESELARRVP